MRPLLLTMAAALMGFATAAPQPPGARQTVGGVVYDSIAGAPLADAIVQLVAADPQSRFSAAAHTDALGGFSFTDVPNGKYDIGFVHPLLDSLGIEPPVRQVLVDAGRATRIDLAIPSPARLRAAICGGTRSMAGGAGAVVVGHVRDAASGSIVPGAKVSAAWLEMTFDQKTISRRTPRVDATTSENGWFAICDAPRDGTILLRASATGDTTDAVEVQVPASGFLRRELFVAASRRADGLLTGRVTGVVSKVAITGAQVRIVGGPAAVTNERGEWTLTGAPVGTRILEVRAVGYYPIRQQVDVFPAASNASRVLGLELATLKSVLDTVRTIANRNADRLHSGFFDRLKSGIGRYLTAEDIARRPVLYTSDLFRTMPGVRTVVDDLGNTRLTVRGGAGLDECEPTLFLNGMAMYGVDTFELDAFVKPKEIMGIEVYTGISVPGRFQTGQSACGAIVIWTK